MKRNILSDSLLFSCAICATALTLPYLWFIFPAIIGSYCWLILAGEGIVILVETWIYFVFLKLDLDESLLISICCNLASVFAGFLLGKSIF
ncbi:hypothetical protein BKM01_08450 [Methanohalophilus portucalensis]|uniref:Uncharacterized protein n=1 Tax=Methanohalophilus portucalensis TaxID=39664 RepID=A0A2D3C9B9_9EURY|nr:hypothetical protein BKM01_08450 [Methanohalophilus portucalensis]